jgi:hypothetical protein
MSNCTHTHGRTLCFECFRSGVERTRARREAYAQRALPFDAPERVIPPLTEQQIAHRRQMLAYLEQARARA